MLVPARSFLEDCTGDWIASGWVKARLRVRLPIESADISPFQTEYRRRLWSYLYHADKLYVPWSTELTYRYSLVLGRPPSISDSYTDAMAPSNVELSDFDPVTGSTSRFAGTS
jgi:hypothetical protein